ncbi:hypothetical protein SAMN02745225_02325 [Ferrithrix thermotolerans DSM 19514]|uniref:Uncharacterized protein n=1 Tax=Ferrithrix thermotolerans DSM 19514 TaxID=1121881 RepID=A0A1M4YF09_9ACTN|nr:hypothetical protein SAMN02745225_02325 [Ferrithrix thermotolerans DSM 19514]
MKTIITSSLGYTSATYVGSPGEVSPQIVGIKPMDASGCTGAPPGLSGEFGFCISVSGSGTYVNWIRTSAYAYNDGCSVAQLLRNGNVIMQMPQVCYGNPTQYCVGSGVSCGTAGTMLSAQFDFYSSSWFHDGDVVCARYEGTSGTFPFSGKQFSPEVCETIE